MTRSKKTDPDRKVYEKTKDKALQVFWATTEPARKAYDESAEKNNILLRVAEDKAMITYSNTIAQAWKDYQDGIYQPKKYSEKRLLEKVDRVVKT